MAILEREQEWIKIPNAGRRLFLIQMSCERIDRPSTDDADWAGEFKKALKQSRHNLNMRCGSQSMYLVHKYIPSTNDNSMHFSKIWK